MAPIATSAEIGFATLPLFINDSLAFKLDCLPIPTSKFLLFFIYFSFLDGSMNRKFLIFREVWSIFRLICGHFEKILNGLSIESATMWCLFQTLWSIFGPFYGSNEPIRLNRITRPLNSAHSSRFGHFECFPVCILLSF